MGSRLPALDWLRGIVMVLMTVDHASGIFNAGRLMTDSAFMYRPGTPLPPGQFFQWLHVSKYPPSLTYIALELGLMALALAALVRLERVPAAWTALAPIRVLGQTALFYYLLHVHFLALAGWLTGEAQHGGLGATYAATVGALVVLFPLCLWYRGYKRAHPEGWPRYV